MAVTKTNSTAVKISKPYALYITPYSGDAVGTKVYQIQDVVRDTTSLVPDDNTVNDIESEYYDEPILSNVILGKVQFAATVGDIQSDLLKDLLGFSVDAVSGISYAPSSYTPLYAKVEIVLKKGAGYLAYVIPKMQLNGKATIESLSTGMAQIPLTGTAYSTEITDGSNTYITPYFINAAYTLPT